MHAPLRARACAGVWRHSEPPGPASEMRKPRCVFLCCRAKSPQKLKMTQNIVFATKSDHIGEFCRKQVQSGLPADFRSNSRKKNTNRAAFPLHEVSLFQVPSLTTPLDCLRYVGFGCCKLMCWASKFILKCVSQAFAVSRKLDVVTMGSQEPPRAS